MLKDITLGRYFPGGTVIHRLDPRTKLASTLAMSICTVTAGGWAMACLTGCAVLITSRVAGLPWSFLLRSVRPYMVLVVVAVGAHIASGGLGGLEMGALMGLRLLAVILAASALSWTTAPVELVDGLTRLGKPLVRLRVPVEPMTAALGIALRFAPIVLDEARSIMRAQAARGADLSGVKRKLDAAVPLISALFERAFARADNLARAMESRGYVPGKPRTSLKTLRFDATDALAVVAVAALCCAGWWIDAQMV